MATLATQRAAGNMLNVTYAAASVGGDKFVFEGRARLHVKNADASPITVTVTAPNPCSYGITNVVHAETYTVAAADDLFIGPFVASKHVDGTGFINVTYSAVTTVTVALVAI